jgi:hypothetical protein
MIGSRLLPKGSSIVRAARRSAGAALSRVCFIFAALSLFVADIAPAAAQEVKPPVVIRRILAGSGTVSSALYDFVELFNASDSPVDIGGWSIQAASGRGTDTLGAGRQITVLPAFTLAPGQAYLVQESGGSSAKSRVQPDLRAGTIVMNATSGKLALVRSSAPLGCNGGSTPCSASQLGAIVDLIGYGDSNFSYGTPVRVGRGTVALNRLGRGCANTKDNRTDFVFDAIAVLAPVNSQSPPKPCGVVEFGACAKLAVPAKVWTEAFPPSGDLPECPDCGEGKGPKLLKHPVCAGCLFSADPGFLYLDLAAYASLARSQLVLVFLRVARAGASRGAATQGTSESVQSTTAAPNVPGGTVAKSATVLESTLESELCADITGVFYSSTPGVGISIPAVGGSGYHVTVGFQVASAYRFFDVPDVTIDTTPVTEDDPG